MEISHPQVQSARESLYELCAQFRKSPARGKSAIIYGENGCGKTRLVKMVSKWAKSLANRMPLVVDQLGTQGNMSIPSIAYASWPEIVDGFKRDEWQILEDLQASTLLILDDVGAEHDPSKIGLEKLYVLLSRREWKWNLITTNVQPDYWPEKFERRISSRLFRNAEHIDMIQVPDFSVI